jgi:uncharacterized delta-60 repeat protein
MICGASIEAVFGYDEGARRFQGSLTAERCSSPSWYGIRIKFSRAIAEKPKMTNRFRSCLHFAARNRSRHRPTRFSSAALIAAAVALCSAAAPAAASASGSLDSVFGTSGYSMAPLGEWAGAAASTVQPDGKIVTVGEAQINGTDVLISSRVTTDGQMDSTYGNGGWVVVDIASAAVGNAIALQPDGKIILAGAGRDVATGTMAFAAVRLLPDGSVDNSFGKAGIALVPIGRQAIASAVAIQGNGAVVLGGMAITSRDTFAAARLTPSGSIDTTFGSAGVSTIGPTGVAWGMVLQPDGKVVLGGEDQADPGQPYMAARVLSNGRPDYSFGNGGVVSVPIGSYAYGDAIALQPDGHIVLAGSAYTNVVLAAVVRLRPNGSRDTSFGSNGVASLTDWNGVNALTLQPSDGKIVLAGVGATAVRFNTNGTADQSFGNGGIVVAQAGTGDAANGVTVQPADGKIVLSGVATIGGRKVLSLVRLSP